MKKKTLILILIGFILMISAQLNGWFDEDLFSSGSDTSDILKPNILIMMDNSGSMNNLIYHPDYDYNISYTNPAGDGIESYSQYKIELYNAQTYYSPIEGWKSFDKGYYFGNRGTTYHTYKATETTFDGVYVLNIKDQPHIDDNPDANPIYLFSKEDSGNEVRISGNFLNFMIYDATEDQRDLWNHFMKYGIWGEGDKSGWDTTNLDGDYGMNRKVRMRVAREVMKAAVAKIFEDAEGDEAAPRIGISRFNSDEGGTVIQACQAVGSLNATQVLISGMEGTTWTPLSEAYAEVYAYFRNGGESSIADEKYFLPFDNAGAQQISASTPITNWCQLNFIIIVTDGEPTQDDQLRNFSDASIFYIDPADNLAPWGDVDVPPPQKKFGKTQRILRVTEQIISMTLLTMHLMKISGRMIWIL